MKITKKLIKGIIEKYLPYYGDNIPMIDYVIVGKNGTKMCKRNGAPACLVGPIDGYYGLAISDAYLFSEETLLPIVLHELVHYSLLIEGKQAEGNEQHNEVFVNKANKIESKTGVKYLNAFTEDTVYPYLKRKSTTYYVLIANGQIDNNHSLVTRFANEKLYKYFVDYFRNYGKETGLNNWKFYKTNFVVCEQFSETVDEVLQMGYFDNRGLIGFE